MTEITQAVELTFRCIDCREDKPESEFPHHRQPDTGAIYRMSRCKLCTSRKKWPLKTISLLKIRPYLDEIVLYAGSKRAAAKELGIAHTQLRHWLGISAKYTPDGRKYYAKRISKPAVVNIIKTLHRLRNEQRRAA